MMSKILHPFTASMTLSQPPPSTIHPAPHSHNLFAPPSPQLCTHCRVRSQANAKKLQRCRAYPQPQPSRSVFCLCMASAQPRPQPRVAFFRSFSFAGKGRHCRHCAAHCSRSQLLPSHTTTRILAPSSRLEQSERKNRPDIFSP